MANGEQGRPHFFVRDRVTGRDYSPAGGGGDPKIRDVEFRAHGEAMRQQLGSSIEEVEALREEDALGGEELRALGSVVVLEASDAAFPLKLDSLEQLTRGGKTKAPRPKWLLLSVLPAAEEGASEQATVWVSDEFRQRFVEIFEKYLEEKTKKGKPKNRALVANISRIRAGVTADLWRSAGAPPESGRHWWELWLRRTDDGLSLLGSYAEARGATLVERALHLPERTVAWIHATWDELQALPFTSVPLAEIRRPEFVQTIADLDRDEQDELSDDLAERLEPAGSSAPAVCHLDSGVRRTHVLLSGSLAESDVHTVVPGSSADEQNHGTPMAGLGLLGNLDDPLLSSGGVALRHRLESVKMLPDTEEGNDPRAYGLVTAQAVAAPEASVDRRRVFCMPVTASPDRPGEPTLWSASVDALAAGVDIAASDDGISLLGEPDGDAARLFVVSAGNVNAYAADYLDTCDTSPVEDPAQAWNALTVGAHTELTDTPTDPTFAGWSALGEAGGLSPHSRTSVMFAQRQWPLKPDICMEGGNVLTDGATDFHERHPLLSLRSTDARSDLALGSVNATSAATAQATRLAALAQASYPEFWPESIRGLLTHTAEWTEPMRAEIEGAPSKTGRLALLRRYGWGVPSEEAVLYSGKNAITMVSQDEFVPFDGPEHKARRFRLHALPWPVDTLRELGGATAQLRVTLSYFIEPAASRRGWRRRYAYQSHGLRFELKTPSETTEQFLRRLNDDAQLEEGGTGKTSSGIDRWLVGPNQRNLGSLHQDVWEGTGTELADSGVLAVHPVGGWWKNSRRKDRVDQPVRYSLAVSLRTAEQGVDLYTPVAVQLDLPIEAAMIPAT
jgi:hypothetical protein